MRAWADKGIKLECTVGNELKWKAGKKKLTYLVLETKGIATMVLVTVAFLCLCSSLLLSFFCFSCSPCLSQCLPGAGAWWWRRWRRCVDWPKLTSLLLCFCLCCMLLWFFFIRSFSSNNNSGCWKWNHRRRGRERPLFFTVVHSFPLFFVCISPVLSLCFFCFNYPLFSFFVPLSSLFPLRSRSLSISPAGSPWLFFVFLLPVFLPRSSFLVCVSALCLLSLSFFLLFSPFRSLTLSVFSLFPPPVLPFLHPRVHGLSLAFIEPENAMLSPLNKEEIDCLQE